MKKDLQIKLKNKQARVAIRHSFYDMKTSMINYGIAIPTEMQKMQSVLGWCAKSVDSIADRLEVRGIKNDTMAIMDIYAGNNPDILFDAVITEALISSCSFLYIGEADEGYITIQAVDAANATGVIDETTGLLVEGYAVLARDKQGKVTRDAYFEPHRTQYWSKEYGDDIFEHNVPYPLLVPVMHRPGVKRPFGRSRINRACMSIVQQAREAIRLMMVSAQFYSFPQRWALTEEKLTIERWSAAVSTMLNLTPGEEGIEPKLGQFASQSMEPFFNQVKLYASLFAGETGLSIAELGFTDSNPSSAESISNAREPLRLAARKAQRGFGSGFLNAGLLAASLRDNAAYARSAISESKMQWYPVFESSLSTLGDSVIKINQGIPGFFNAENFADLAGIDAAGTEEI